MAIKNIFKKKQWKADYEAGRDAYNAGQFKVAETHLRSALGKALEIDDASYGDTALLLGQVVRRLERYEESLELTAKSFRYFIGLFGSSDPRTVQAHLSLVLADPQHAHDDAALRVSTHHLCLTQFEAKSWQIVRTAALALGHFGAGEREKALGQAQDACAFVLGDGRQELGAWPPVAEEFALELSRLGYHDLAARFMSSQLRIHEERFGEKSEEAALTRLTLGEFYLRCADWSKAETALARSLEQLKLKHGPKSDLARRATICLGQALARQGRLEQAAPYLNESLEKLRQDQGHERLEALVWLLEYKCMISAGDAERGALWRELEAIWEANPTELARSRIFQGFRAAQMRLQEAWELGAADRFLQAVLGRVRQWRGPHHPDVAATMLDLGMCAALREDDAKAMSYAEQALALDEGADSLIRAVALFGELGERERAQKTAQTAARLVKSYSPGLEQGRRHAAFAQALLMAGDTTGALEQAEQALEQLPDNEQAAISLVMAEAHVLNGNWTGAERLYRETVPRVTEPVTRAKAYLQLAWVLCLTGRFPEMQEALAQVQELASLRPEHPIIIGARAVASQGAYYSGNMYQGKEERDVVFAFLRKNGHQQTRRALTILTLLDPFGPDEFGTELDVGTQILAASRYPEAVCCVFPVKDVGCIGLRHLTRALFFHGQEDIARERLSQYRQRFLDTYAETNPLASAMHLCAASLASTPSEKIELLEAARRGLRELGSRHVNLFPTLSLLAEQYIEVAAIDKAKVTIAEALAIRKSSRLKDWLATLERGQLPALTSEPGRNDIPAEAEKPPASTYSPASIAAQMLADEDPDETESASGSAGFQESADEESVETITDEPTTYLEPPHTEDETTAPPADSSSGLPPAGLETADLEDSTTLVAYGGATDVTRIPMAVALADRDEPPTEEEVEELLVEVTARFGADRRPRQDAQLMLALLYPDGSETALRLWNEALEVVFKEDFETLLALESRARDANATTLVVATLQRRLADEVDRHGDQATESIETLTRLARAYESLGLLEDAYQRVIMVTEILRSWFGVRSRRLLEPLAQLIRICEKRDDVPTALDHHLERQRLLEAGQANPEELFSSRVELLPIRALLGQVDELMEEAETSNAELRSLGPAAGSEFASVLLTAAVRIERMHWRIPEAIRLLDMALAAVPEGEVSLFCRLQVAFAECQARRDYRSQAEGLRRSTVDKAAGLESETRAEILHEAAESCLRVSELTAAREIAERLLEERIAGGGRKDQWAGRALLVLAEADLRSYRLEGTETAIAMSRPSLEGSQHWTKAQLLKTQSEFFLGREEEAYAILASLPEAETIDLHLILAVWQGRAESICSELEGEALTPLANRYRSLEKIPLEEAVGLLEFFARAGRVRMLGEGLQRIETRLSSLLPTDIRTARINTLRAALLLWERRFAEAEQLLQRVLDILPTDRVEMPDGLSMLVVRGLLVGCLLAQDKVRQAETQAKTGAAEAAEVLGEEDIRAIAFRSQLAFCAEARGDQEESLVILDEILVPLQDRLGDTHTLLRDIYRGLSKAFLEQDDLESARLTAEEALRIDRESRGLSIHLVEDLHLLAKIEQREDRAEAKNLLDTAYELAVEVLPASHPFIARLESDRERLEHEPSDQSAALSSEGADALDEDSIEADASLDGWEVVDSELSEESLDSELSEEWMDEESVEASDEDSGDDSGDDSAEALFTSEEELPEDSVFETPVVDFSSEGHLEELELTDEEAAEERSVSFELERGSSDGEAPVEAPSVEDMSPGADDPVDDDSASGDEPRASITGSEAEVFTEEPASEGDLFVEEPLSEQSADGEPVIALETEAEAQEPDDSDSSEGEEGGVLELASDTGTSDPDAPEPDTSDAAVIDAIEALDEEPPTDGSLETFAPNLAARAPAFSSMELSKAYHAGPRASTASVELSPDFFPVPYRVPLIEEVIEEESHHPSDESIDSESNESAEHTTEDVEAEPDVEALAVSETEAESDPSFDSDEAPARAAEVSEAPPAAEDSADEPEADEPEAEPDADELEAGPESVEPQAEPEVVEPGTEPESAEPQAEISVTAEAMAAIVDPEASLLPLAPVFFLPVPWSEATEAPFDPQFAALDRRFQEQFKNDGEWRDVVEEAVSTVRQDPTPAAGYFLFLIGAQLEVGGRLHSADLCLATAIELLESGPAFGAACHMAGRVAGRRGELRRALDYFERAAELADEPELAILKVDAAECHLGLGRPEEALISFEEVFDYLNESVPKVQALAVQAKMAQIHLLVGDPDSSLSLAEDTLQRLSPKNSGTYRVLGRILLSRSFARLGRHELALELAEQAWEGARRWSTKRREGRRIAISNLVDIYSLLGRFEKAEEMIRESGLLGWGLAESELLLRAGHVACSLGKLDAARSYLKLGQSFLTRFRSPALWRSSFLELEAELALQQGDAARADRLAGKALDLFEQEATGPVDRSRHSFRAARIAGATGDLSRARALAEEAYSLRDLHLGANHPHTESVDALTKALG